MNDDTTEPAASTDVDAPPDALVAAADGLIRERLRFGFPVAVISLGAYFGITALTGFTEVLDGRVFGPMSWTLVLLMLLVPLVWVFTVLYRRKADRWDQQAAQIRADLVAANKSEDDA